MPNNPFSYRLLNIRDKTREGITATLKENRRRCKHIFASLMRRLKSAYKDADHSHQRDLGEEEENNINNGYNLCLDALGDPATWPLCTAIIPPPQVAEVAVATARQYIGGAVRVVTILFSTSPGRRTIVGLDARGVCTSGHHCTGKDNKIDEEAWEYFRR